MLSLAGDADGKVTNILYLNNLTKDAQDRYRTTLPYSVKYLVRELGIRSLLSVASDSFNEGRKKYSPHCNKTQNRPGRSP